MWAMIEKLRIRSMPTRQYGERPTGDETGVDTDPVLTRRTVRRLDVSWLVVFADRCER
jgi:hypothetical protein